MCRRKRDEWVDDGRVIADMGVPGMPGMFGRSKKRRFDPFGERKRKQEPVELTRREKRSIGLGAASAYLLFALVIIAFFGLFLLFCAKVWFR